MVLVFVIGNLSNFAIQTRHLQLRVVTEHLEGLESAQFDERDSVSADYACTDDFDEL